MNDSDDYIEDEDVEKNETGMTKEDQEEILFAIDPAEIHDYVPKRYRKLPPEDQPSFQLKILSARDAAELENNSLSSHTGHDNKQFMRVKSGTTTLKALVKGCVGWKNWKTKNGTEAKFRENAGKPNEQTFDCVPNVIRGELAKVITTGLGLTEQAAKNSD